MKSPKSVCTDQSQSRPRGLVKPPRVNVRSLSVQYMRLIYILTGSNINDTTRCDPDQRINRKSTSKKRPISNACDVMPRTPSGANAQPMKLILLLGISVFFFFLISVQPIPQENTNMRTAPVVAR